MQERERGIEKKQALLRGGSSWSYVFSSTVPKAPKKRPSKFCEGFCYVAIQARTLIASVITGLATLKPIFLALGARQRP